MNSLDKIKDYIEIIKDNSLPVDYITSIDVDGNFEIKEPKYNDYCYYLGKVIDNGVLVKESFGSNYPDDNDVCKRALTAHNISGYNFRAIVSFYYNGNSNEIVNNFYDRNNKVKIDSMYDNYELIVKSLDNNIEDDYIKKVFGLNFFNSNVIDQKAKTK